MPSTELERHTGANSVDVEEVPSAEWGWSKENPKFIHIGGLLAAAFLLIMMHGNHVGRVEDVFLIDGQALNISVTSYDHQLHFGLTGCRRTVPHLQRLLVHLETSLADLENIH